MEIDKYTSTMNMKEQGMDEVLEYIRERREEPNKTALIYSGIRAIDNMYHGFSPGQYIIVSGMVNGGKTTMMFNMAFNMAKRGYGVVYVSLEKGGKALYTRLVALHAMVDYNRIKKGGKGTEGLSDYYYGKLMDAAKDIKDNIKPNFECIESAQGIGLPKILAEVEKLKNRMKIDVLFVDYLGCIGTKQTYSTRPDLDEAMLSQDLQAYGKINNFLVITAVQLKTPSSKEIRNKSKKATAQDASQVEVNTEDLAGSKMIIADADAAMGVILNSDSPPTKMYVYGTKARDDESRRTVVLDFDGRLGRISDPQLEPGQVGGLDQIVYNKEITEEELKSDDGLFTEEPLAEIKQLEAVTKKDNVKVEENKTIVANVANVAANAKTTATDDDFDFLENKTSEPKIEESPSKIEEIAEIDEIEDNELDIFST